MLKRVTDLTLALIALAVLSPLLLAAAILLYLAQGAPVLFTQPRAGLKGKIFKLYKFRTMRDLRPGEDPHGMDRLTPIGKLIRSLSIDELPSLLNVLKGELSLVGPRPLLVQYLERYSEEQMKRHDVLPGLTGWAQVNGRNTLSWEDKFRHDVWYAENAGLWLDLKIIFLTVKTIFWREGINASQSDIMEEFDPGLYVLGRGGHAKVVISSIQASGLKVMGIFDDDPAALGQKVLGVPVVGSMADIKKFKVKKAVIGIGSNETRTKIAQEHPLHWITVIHPNASVHPSAKIGRGTVVFAGAVIQPDAKIGDHSIINTGAIVEHDCLVGDFAHICPGSVLAGGVKVGDGAMLGAGTKVIPCKEIGRLSTVGAGSVVIESIPDHSVAVGVPAQVIKTAVSHIQRKKA